MMSNKRKQNIVINNINMTEEGKERIGSVDTHNVE